MGKLGTKRITEDRYNKIKQLIDMGISQSTIIKELAISLSTVSRVKMTKDYDDYIALRKTERERYLAGLKNEAVEKPKVEKVVKYTVNDTKPNVDSQKMLTQLTRIADGIEKLIDAWEQQPKKKGIFK